MIWSSLRHHTKLLRDKLKVTGHWEIRKWLHLVQLALTSMKDSLIIASLNLKKLDFKSEYEIIKGVSPI